MQAKPILITRLKIFDYCDFNIIEKNLKKSCPDYNHIVIQSHEIKEDVSFQVLNLKDEKEVDLEELKKIIQDARI